MMLRRRKRRPDDGVFMPRDADAWRRLIRCARKADASAARMADLAAAARKAVRAVVPPGHARRDSVFLQLVIRGRTLAAGSWTWTETRDAALAQLRELADACAAILDTPAPAPRVRADLE